tara:strand:- start:9 stop:2054 length:2046 start_codon:yes stop_codon:yes gene_type:complete
MSDLPAKQPLWISRIFSSLIKGYGKKEDKPTEENHGANWNNPYGVDPTYSQQQALYAYGGHGYTYAAVSRSAADLAALPLVLTSGRGKSAKIIDDSPVLDLFDEPSTNMDGYLFREQLRTDLMLSGNCYILLLGISEQPDSIIRLHPAEVEIVTDERSGITGYRHESNGQVVIYPLERVLHGRNPTYAKGPKSLYGVGVVEPLTREINADINAQKLASTSSAKGRPDILIHPLDPADVWGLERRREILDQYRGLASEGGAMVLSGQVGIEPLKLTPREMEFEASRRMARESISAVCGVPPVVLGLPSANYATARQQNITYWTNQQKASKRLDHLFTLIAKKFSPDYRIYHDFTDVEALQSVRDSQLLRVQQHIANGMSPADAYKYENMADAPIVTDSRSKPEEEVDTRSLAMVISKTLDYEDEKKKTWHNWIRREHSPQERRLYRAARSYLSGASKRYASRLRNVMISKNIANGSVVKTISDWSELLDEAEERKRIQAEIGSVWIKGFMNAGAKELARIFTDSKAVQGSITFSDFSIPGMMVSQLASELIKTTTEKIRRVVEFSLLEGASETEVAERILASKTFDKARASLIARTEATRSLNAAKIRAGQIAVGEGLVVRKQWVTENDDKVREEHVLLDGQTVMPDDVFEVAGMTAPGPGQFGESSMDCNCRCMVLTVVIK